MKRGVFKTFDFLFPLFVIYVINILSLHVNNPPRTLCRENLIQFIVCACDSIILPFHQSAQWNGWNFRILLSPPSIAQRNTKLFLKKPTKLKRKKEYYIYSLTKIEKALRSPFNCLQDISSLL